MRPVYAFTETFKLSAEIGHDQIKATDGTRKLTKFTVAPTWSLSGPGFWARPELRVFYTYATWNEAAQRAASEMDPESARSETGALIDRAHAPAWARCRGHFGSAPLGRRSARPWAPTQERGSHQTALKGLGFRPERPA
ncbi:LamB porin [Azotobacter chroococcum]|uniref:LamB porin n=1 Tax=Azotobacter chroococcum TaxID=353 RepID=A0A4R1PLW3_9GAMM|nr:LamB porin [Azotobacter chroococcum]